MRAGKSLERSGEVGRVGSNRFARTSKGICPRGYSEEVAPRPKKGRREGGEERLLLT